jgi:hypothetical protein
MPTRIGNLSNAKPPKSEILEEDDLNRFILSGANAKVAAELKRQGVKVTWLPSKKSLRTKMVE